MSAVLGIFLWAVAVLLSIPVATLLAQVLLARRHSASPAGRAAVGIVPRPSVAVVIPAHDEAGVIVSSLRSVQSQLLPGDRLLVVADNCSDDTAALARRQGAEVVVRESAQRGKGYALDFGLLSLGSQGREVPEVIVFMDADCHATPGTIEQLARLAVNSGRPVQAYSRMRSGRGAGNLAKIAEFAWIVRNFVRPLGWLRRGWPCQLMGTGMAMPRSLLSKLALANGHIVEDMQLGIDLAIAGHPAIFCPTAEVGSRFPETREATALQRTRWEHGHLGMILSGFPRLLGAAFRQRNAGLLAQALDLAVPPLALLCLLSLTLALGGLMAAGMVAPLTVLVSLLPAIGIALAVLLAWEGWGRGVLLPGDLWAVASYALAKIPIYLRFLVKREQRWVKTRRD